jgi:hypothetical protein
MFEYCSYSMEKKDEKSPSYYLKLANEYYNNLNIYSIEERVEFSLHMFNAYLMKIKLYKKIEKKYHTKDKISNNILNFQMNKCQNELLSLEKYLDTKINEIPNNYPKKTTLEETIKLKKMKGVY